MHKPTGKRPRGRPQATDETLSVRYQVRLTPSLIARLNGLQKPSAFIREAIAEKFEREDS